MAGSQPLAHRPSRYIHLQNCDSTNAEAMRLAAHGELGPVWVLSDRQMAGRGRSGRTWASEPGNFFASYLTVLPGSPQRAYQVALVTGVAVAEAIGALLPNADGLRLRLKWPNDIMSGPAKLGGILVESTQVSGGLAVVIGVGLNLVSHPGGEPRPVTNLSAFGRALNAEAVLSELDLQIARWLAIWSVGTGFADVRQAWLSLSGQPGERLMVNSGTGPVEGAYQGLDQDGALILIDDAGNQRIFSYGDVTLVG